MSIREKVEDKIYEKASKRYQKLKRWQKTAVKWLIGLAVVVYLFIRYIVPPVQNWWTSRVLLFPEGVAGILVLRIEGDEKNSLQGDLVNTLDTELSKEAPEQQIEVHAHNESVTEAMGLKQAHAKARKIGKDCHALLVIWGNRVGEKKFHPRITITDDWQRIVIGGDRTLEAQIINEVSFPAEVVNQTIYLTHFIIGYFYFSRKNYALALNNFQLALIRRMTNTIELNDIRFYIATSYLNLATDKKNMVLYLQQAIAYYDTVLGFYNTRDIVKHWATIHNNLGNAYAQLPTGDRSENLLKAIANYEAALSVYTEKDSVDWARVQHNMGNAFLTLPIGDRNENLQKAIIAFEAALRVRTAKSFPLEWGMTQNSLGVAYMRLPAGDRVENLILVKGENLTLPDHSRESRNP